MDAKIRVRGVELDKNIIKFLLCCISLSKRKGDGYVIYNDDVLKGQLSFTGLNLSNKDIDLYFSKLVSARILRFIGDRYEISSESLTDINIEYGKSKIWK